MQNAFPKEEKVAFDKLAVEFDDQLVISRMVEQFTPSDREMEQAGDTILRPMPFIKSSKDGPDATANFGDTTELSVPSTLGFDKHVAWTLTGKELREFTRMGKITRAAKQRLASDINVALMNLAANQGTMVATKATAASAYEDIALWETTMDRVGVPMEDRFALLSSNTNRLIAGSLAGKDLPVQRTDDAYSKSRVGNLAGFEIHKLDYANRIAAAAGTTVTVNGANQYYTPKATDATQAGKLNVDNRYQNLAITVGGGTVAIGDCFTISGVFEAHHITKASTANLKTFRIIDIVSGGGGTGTVRISPPIISNGGGTDAEADYKNVSATPANGAAITFLNVAAADINPFFHREAIELTPGGFSTPDDSTVAVMTTETPSGVRLTMQKQWDINLRRHKVRVDTIFGVVMLQPQMCGIGLFGQT